MTPHDLKQIADLLDEKMDEKLTPINVRLDTMDTKIDAIAETQAEHTEALNIIIDWCEEAGKRVRLPLLGVK